jgi:hypothetical protein
MCVYRHFVARHQRAPLRLKFSRSGLNWVVGGLLHPHDEKTPRRGLIGNAAIYMIMIIIQFEFEREANDSFDQRIVAGQD